MCATSEMPFRQMVWKSGLPTPLGWTFTMRPSRTVHASEHMPPQWL